MIAPHPVVAEPMNPAATAITIADLRSTFVDPSTIALQCAISPKPFIGPSVIG
ncbi:MAG: hypothetical protein QE267_03690 [Akkermansiaceae bacterium]|nr:hypothetical protein [Akkermansiaceae bacterium]